MPPDRTIPDHFWETARRRLVFFFAHRGMHNAEDLAQETLMAILRRQDYHVAKEEDFIRVCYGFANLILKSGRRKEAKFAAAPIGELQVSTETEGGFLRPVENMVFTHQVVTIGETRLSEQEWALILNASQGADPNSGLDPPADSAAVANRTRVRLHRARRKLGRLLGLKE